MTTTKNGDVRTSVYTPENDEKKPAGCKNSIPTYIATTPGGYMNSILWIDVIRIFCELAFHRQGLGHRRQGVLFIDGCPSHPKEETIDYLKKRNIMTVFFPSNSSHILQPCDGATFANYKKAISKKTQNAALLSTISNLNPVFFDLMNCIEAHRTSVTPEVIRSSFRKRGIWPWSPATALANAHTSNPKSAFISCPEDAQQALMSDKIVLFLQETLTPKKKTKRKVIEVANHTVAMENLPDWTPLKPGRKRKAIEPESMESFSSNELDYNSNIELELEQSDEERTFELPKIASSSKSSSCDHCDQQSSLARMELACLECSNYYLCFSCGANPKILQEHMKTHPELEGRRTRRRQI